MAAGMIAGGIAGGIAGMIAGASLPAALIVVVAGTGLGWILDIGPGITMAGNMTAFHFAMLEASDFATAFAVAVIPQIPLTLTNAIIVTSALALIQETILYRANCPPAALNR